MDGVQTSPSTSSVGDKNFLHSPMRLENEVMVRWSPINLKILFTKYSRPLTYIALDANPKSWKLKSCSPNHE